MGKSEVEDSGAVGVGDARSSKTNTGNAEASEGSADIERGKERTSADSNGDEGSPSSSSSSRRQVVRRATREVKRAIRIPALIIIIGAAASALILKIGISAARSSSSNRSIWCTSLEKLGISTQQRLCGCSRRHDLGNRRERSSILCTGTCLRLGSNFILSPPLQT
jgi:hypothetical protein